MINVKEYAILHKKTETRVRQLISCGKLKPVAGSDIMLDENTPWPKGDKRGPKPRPKAVGHAQEGREGGGRHEVGPEDGQAFPPASSGRNYTQTTDGAIS